MQRQQQRSPKEGKANVILVPSAIRSREHLESLIFERNDNNPQPAKRGQGTADQVRHEANFDSNRRVVYKETSSDAFDRSHASVSRVVHKEASTLQPCRVVYEAASSGKRSLDALGTGRVEKFGSDLDHEFISDVDNVDGDCFAERKRSRKVFVDAAAPFESLQDRSVAQLLATAKSCCWRGSGELPQLATHEMPKGLFVLVDLWSGFAGAALALMALGVRCIVLSAECDAIARRCAESVMPNIVHVKSVEEVNAAMFKLVVQRRDIKAFIVGGGCPCQGNSALNLDRQGWQDPRTRQASHVARIVNDLQRTFGLPVLSFLENVASMPPEVRDRYSSIIKGDALEFSAADCGWVSRNRLFWGSSLDDSVVAALNRPKSLQIPHGWVFDKDAAAIRYTGTKPIPAVFQPVMGYVALIDPKQVKSGEQQPMHTFAREFWHPTDRIPQASAEAIERFYQDNRRFTPTSYEAHSLVWKGDQWRQLTPEERATLHCVPPAVVQAVPKSPAAQRVAKQNSLIGNGFHLPSVMVFFCLLLQLLPKAAALSKPIPEMHETWLKDRIAGSIWDQARLRSFPGLLQHAEVVREMQRQFPPDISQTVSWDKLQMNEADLVSLQCHTAFNALRQQTSSNLSMPPLCYDKRSRARLMAVAGRQRAAGDSSFGLDHLLPPGMGKEAHMQETKFMQAPFSEHHLEEEDLLFAIECMAVFGPYVARWREQQMAAFQRVVSALRVVDTQLKSFQTRSAQVVAAHKSPAVIAFLTAINKWPDRDQALGYIRGFDIVGQVTASGVFRAISEQLDQDPRQAFWGDAAVEAIDAIIRSPPPKETAQILELTMEEVQKGFCSELLQRESLDDEFGPGNWRPLHRFLVTQPCGKVRVIDNAKRSQHNDFTQMSETIFVTSLDVIPAVASSFAAAVLQRQADSKTDLPPWAELELGTDDLPDAYRGCPVSDRDRGASVVAVHTPSGWRFTKMLGLAYGLKSAVIQFNRLPLLLCASARRLFGTIASSYFDDILTVDLPAGGGRPAVGLVLSKAGAQPQASKAFSMGSVRHYLGAVANLSCFQQEMIVTIGPKTTTRAKLVTAIDHHCESGTLTPADAATLRGQAGWLATNSAGRVGRMGSHFLAARQYGDQTHLSADDRDMLKFIRAVVEWVPSRCISVSPRQEPPIIIYSDASFEPGRPVRVGWVIVFPNHTIGRTAVIPEQIVGSWQQRKSQIFPAEAFLTVLIPSMHSEVLADRQIVWFIDNEGAASAFIRGDSKTADVRAIVQQAQLSLLKLRCLVWVEWIDSASNPSDGLSRDGLSDAWTVSQEWDLAEVQVPSSLYDLEKFDL